MQDKNRGDIFGYSGPRYEDMANARQHLVVPPSHAVAHAEMTTSRTSKGSSQTSAMQKSADHLSGSRQKVVTRDQAMSAQIIRNSGAVVGRQTSQMANAATVASGHQGDADVLLKVNHTDTLSAKKTSTLAVETKLARVAKVNKTHSSQADLVARAKAEARARAEAIAQAQAQAVARARAQDQVKAKIEAKQAAKIRQQARMRRQAEMQAKAQAQIRINSQAAVLGTTSQPSSTEVQVSKAKQTKRANAKSSVRSKKALKKGAKAGLFSGLRSKVARRHNNTTTDLHTVTPDNSAIASAFRPITETAVSESVQPASMMTAAIVNSQATSALSDKSGHTVGENEVYSVMPTGEAAITQTTPSNFLGRLANAKLTITFNINKARVFAVLRYLAVALILVASAYLAWDTYSTNQSVKNSFSSNPASAMSISGTNPATADQTAISQEARQAYTAPAGQPRYIYIPAISVNARVMSVGVNSKGNIDTPANLNDTAWYDGSAKPNQEGQVFIDGHTSFSNTIDAAFNDLPKLKAGDAITIETGDGTKVNYKVTTVKTVDADKVDMGEALNPPAGAKKGLTLMTCTGTFNYRTQTADKRLVVYAVQE